ncbi:MAG: biosynthetic-type acetolactate synthase large subunit [Candidatus Latescibacterota bacterium]|nr:MAG: biosynthetic-type acetolactate synthase large subunit [Candidatus Latescibacterota bacterium]RKY71666.1 MAG: biosynthetic-type acetolactate synthase large subunit [Candidatus Latescibacterota bacterium]
MTGAEIFVECLKREGVKEFFGYPGGAVIPLFDELYKHWEEFRFILVRHEQAAAHAADGYARATGKVGVCIATSGPGATNLTTGIATAYMDSVPIVAFTGQVRTAMIGSDAFQEADVTGITRPITKHNYLVKDVEDLARIIKEAFYIARTGRPGPVLVDVPVDIGLAETEFDYPEKVELRGYKPNYKGHPLQIKKVAKAIEESERPLLYVGGGVVISGAHEEVRQLAEKANIPVTTTLMALGTFPPDHPLYLGMPGMHGTRYANMAFIECDLIIAVGARFDDRVTGKIDAFAPHAKIAHIDIDPAAISKNVEVHIPVVGDAKLILRELLPLVKPRPRNSWNDQIDEWKRKWPLTYRNSDSVVKPQYVVEQIYEATKDRETIIATEVGQNQMWTAQYYKFHRPRTLLTSGGLGTMGYGFPASIGAQAGRPDALVIDIAGDGSIQMNIQELATVVQHGLPIKIAILNNGYLGMVRQWQELFWGRRYSAVDIAVQPDFVKLAEAYGIKGMRIEHPSEVRDAIEEALKEPGPVLMDFRIEREENVFPMVPAGKALHEMIGGLA